MSERSKFRIAIIGSGPIGKLLLSSVTPHPRIEYVQFEADTLPFRPSFGYGVGPQTLNASARLNPAIGKELYDQCIISPVWMNFYHGGAENEPLPTIEVPTGVYGRIGREELLELLDSFAPKGHEVQYGKKLKSVSKLDGGLKLDFEDGSLEYADALWAADGMNSLCRQIVQGDQYRPATYSGHVAFRGKIDSKKVEAAVGKQFAEETYMFIGVKGWHILIFPIGGGKFTNIAAFAREEVQKKRGRDFEMTTEELLSYFPGGNVIVQNLLRLLNDQPGGCVVLELTHMHKLETFHSPDLNITTFGDAANGMLPHIAGSMSTGFIGVTTFLHDELNPRLENLKDDASKQEISEVLSTASQGYEETHMPLAQKLEDLSWEQGFVFSGAITEVEELQRRPRVLWASVSGKREGGRIQA